MDNKRYVTQAKTSTRLVAAGVLKPALLLDFIGLQAGHQVVNSQYGRFCN
jgi:hypothetical protein